MNKRDQLWYNNTHLLSYFHHDIYYLNYEHDNDPITKHFPSKQQILNKIDKIHFYKHLYYIAEELYHVTFFTKHTSWSRNQYRSNTLRIKIQWAQNSTPSASSIRKKKRTKSQLSKNAPAMKPSSKKPFSPEPAFKSPLQSSKPSSRATANKRTTPSKDKSSNTSRRKLTSISAMTILLPKLRPIMKILRQNQRESP